MGIESSRMRREEGKDAKETRRRETAMSIMRVLTMCGFAILVLAANSPKTYTNDFEKAEVGKVPDDFMVLDGTFAVREVDGNRCLELAPDPIGSFGALFGPDGLTAMDVKARIWASSAGKRFPEFGIGADDAGGFKLFLVPSKHILELRKGDDPVASVPFDWKDGAWTWLRLRVEPKDDKRWAISGKAWAQGQAEPGDWGVSALDSEAPSAGKASIWGSDYSEKPIRFDDLSVMPAGDKH
jgi:hypothetical protein